MSRQLACISGTSEPFAASASAISARTWYTNNTRKELCTNKATNPSSHDDEMLGTQSMYLESQLQSSPEPFSHSCKRTASQRRLCGHSACVSLSRDGTLMNSPKCLIWYLQEVLQYIHITCFNLRARDLATFQSKHKSSCLSPQMFQIEACTFQWLAVMGTVLAAVVQWCTVPPKPWTRRFLQSRSVPSCVGL